MDSDILVTTAIVIQCRHDSSRLFGKILFELEPNLTILEFMIQRLSVLNRPIIVATTIRPEDEIIAKKVIELYLKYPLLQLFRGSFENVALRLYEATDGYDYFFRITGDDIFTDLESLEKNIYLVETNSIKCDYGFVSNMIRGFDYELFNRASVLKVIELFKDDPSIEHLDHYFEADLFERIKLEYPEQYNGKFKGISLALDTPSDWELIKILYLQIKQFTPKHINSFILEYIKINPYIVNINKVPLVSIYMVIKNSYPVWLTEAIHGVLTQTYKNFEFIIVDYGTTSIRFLDPVLDKLTDHNIKFYKIPNFSTISFIDAIKYAISKCKGKYVLRADADDILYSTAIEKMLRVALETNASMVMSDYDSTDNKKEIETSFLPCQALVDRKKYDYVKYVKNQAFRDGVNLKQTFNKYGFLIKQINDRSFFHRSHPSSLTGSNITEDLKILDNKILNKVSNNAI